MLTMVLSTFASMHMEAQGDALTDKTLYETKLSQSISQHTSQSFTINTSTLSKDGTNNVLAGTASCLGASNVNYTAVFSEADILLTFTATMPAGGGIDWNAIPLVSSVYPDKELLKIPDVIKSNLKMGQGIIEFSPDGTSMSKVTLGLGYENDWTILREAKLKMTNVGVSIEVQPSNPTGATGILRGNFSMAGTSGMEISAALSKSINEWKISASISDFSFAELLDNFNFSEASFPTAAIFSRMMGTTNLSVDLFPFKQEISMTVTNTSFGILNIQAERLEGADVTATSGAGTRVGWGILAGYSFPEGFAFNSAKVEEPWRGMLSFLDNVKNKTGIYFSNYDGEPASMLPVFEELGFEGPVYKGVTFITGMNISNGYQDLKKILSNTSFKSMLVKDVPVENLTLQANLPLDPTLMKVEAAIQFKETFNLVDVIWLQDIKLIFEANGGSPMFSLATNIAVKVEPGKEPLTFYFKGSAEPTSLTISGSGSLTNYWDRPYGFPARIGNVVLGTGLNFSSPPIPKPDNTIISGELEMMGIRTAATIGFDMTDMTKNFLEAKLINFNFKTLVDSFTTAGIAAKLLTTPYLGQFLSSSRIDTALVRFALKTFSLTAYNIPKEIKAGGELDGAGQVLNWRGRFNIRVDAPQTGMEAGLSILGYMTPLTIKPKFTVFSVTGAGNKGGPEIFVDLTVNHVIKGLTSAFLSGSNTPNTPNRFVYVNAGLNILEAASANAFLELTDRGYLCSINGNLYGFLSGSINAEIRDFSSPLGSYIRARANAGALRQNLLDPIRKEIARLGFGNDVWNAVSNTIAIDSLKFEGVLESLQSNPKVFMYYRIGNTRRTFEGQVPVSSLADFIRPLAVNVANEARSACTIIFNGIVSAGQATIQGLANTAVTATQQATTAITTATSLIPNPSTVTGAAGTVYSEVNNIGSSILRNTQTFLGEIASFNASTILKIYNKTKENLTNFGNRTLDKAKVFFTGKDNEELIIVSGPSYFIHVKNQGKVLKGVPTRKHNTQISMSPLSPTLRAEETWQLIPNDVEGSFYLVCAYNGLIVTKPWPTHLILIPHESDHKNRERMLLENVPNEPGWFYLKFRDRNTYAEVKYVSVDRVMQWVLAPVATRPTSDMGKFRFDKASDVDWSVKTFPPRLTQVVPFSETSTYTMGTDPQMFLYRKGNFRAVPDLDLIRNMGIGGWPKNQVAYDRRIGVTYDKPMPSGKNGSLLQAEGDPRVYIMENGKRRHIPDPATFNLMNLRPEMIIVVSSQDLERIPAGSQIPSGLQANASLVEKALYQVDGNPTVYIVYGNTLRGIPDPETLTHMGYNFSQVKRVSTQNLNMLPKGPNMPSRRNGALVQAIGDPAVYVMDGGLRRHIPDIETLNAMSLNIAALQRIPIADNNAIPRGADIPSRK